MHVRRLLTLLAGVVMAGAIGDGAIPLLGQSQGGAAVKQGRQISLKEQLTFGLRARTKSESAFIDLVVAKVDSGELPRPLVDSTFLWARDRAARRRDSVSVRPMVYFRPGLLARAKKLKIDI